jgi:DNA-binding transcriptional MerR regulator
MAEPSAPPTPVSRTGSHLSIGEVLALLLEEFPDVTISKIRFLESQGLIDPERTASGYRKFYADDVELLRCILREQRENYLPLRVIKDRIDSGEIDPTGEHDRPDAVHRGIKNVGVPTDARTHPSAGTARGAAALFQRTDQVPVANDSPTPASPVASPAASSTSGAAGTQLSMSDVDPGQPETSAEARQLNRHPSRQVRLRRRPSPSGVRHRHRLVPCCQDCCCRRTSSARCPASPTHS